MALEHIAQPFDFDRLQQMVVINGAICRLLLACLLGGLVGLDREIHRKAAGVRTNLLICMGAAFFTLLSAVLAGDANPDKGRVASNIVQGVGFLGAGLILHNRNRISGLTSAAAIFAVASIGMACGAGLYGAAAVATGIVVLALELVGLLDRYANLKSYTLTYETRGSDQTRMLETILQAMDHSGLRLANVERDEIGALQRVSFELRATRKEHESLRRQLTPDPAIAALRQYNQPEED